MDLPLKYKAFWLYICDRCDNAGAWEPNIRLAAVQIGEQFELSEILRIFSGRINQLGDGKLFITKFIPFQYGNLSPNCRAHQPILNNIEKLRVSKGYPKGIHTLVEKEKEKDKEEEEVQEKKKPNLVPTAEDIYNAYPLKKERPQALIAIKAAIRHYGGTFLLERTLAYAKARRGDTAYVPYPQKWFKREGFNDDPATWVRREYQPAIAEHKAKDVT